MSLLAALRSMFGLDPLYPLLIEKLLRPVIVYCFLVIGLRLAGKRELAQINTFDLVVLLMLSNTVQNAIIGDDNSVTGGMLGAVSLLLTNYLVVRFLFRRVKLDRFLEGEPVLLIEHGRVRHQRLDRELISLGELTAAAHRQGFRSLDDVEECVLETGGSLAFIGKDPAPAQTHYDDLVKRLDAISAQLQALQAPGAGRQ
ncbi:MAG TPA: DUF421 domain-containing protein [Kouleothrix sp.]|uniref:DUF421 domain-containing protein n=1 Tax=Kouleothrix sp. TaxID=2779161 RepID=UPI002C23D8F2|nr:DUF421 domain-containing protein [Kouleothrix sp.]HRC76745.1 DUF421 domain-containing protein [Kouleothrix sp.]